MQVELWVWLLTIAGIVGLVIFDFVAHIRVAHEPAIREAAIWSTIYIAMAIVFGFGLWFVTDAETSGDYFGGYITEKALSVDNLFVFLVIMTSFRVPRIYQQKVLMIGVVMALVMRTVLILLGAAAIERFSWVFYIFGIFLIWTAWKLAKESADEDGAHHVEENMVYENAAIRFVKRILPTTDHYHGDRLFTRIDGKRFVTPMLIVMVAIGSADLLFAFDSIPAIYAFTEVPYIVFTANAFALLGLRQLYFLIGGLLQRLVYLSVGLAAILGFIGVKLIIHAMRHNELGFVNDGHPIETFPEINTWVSLGVISTILIVATTTSLLKTRQLA